MQYCATATKSTADQKFCREARASRNSDAAIATWKAINNVGKLRNPNIL